jgi:hypothetical protein
MRVVTSLLLGVAIVGASMGCGGSESGADGAAEPSGPPPGYTRFVTRPTPEVAPGTDQLFVQWLTDPAEEDMDALDVTGFQSEGGHHVILFATQESKPVGLTRLWQESDMTGVLRYVGGLGEGADKQKLPEGTTFRIPKGWSLIANLHYVNVTSEPIVGEATIDFKFAKPSSTRQPVGIFLNMATKFSVPAQGDGETSTVCEVKEDLSMIRLANHMHSHGAQADTTVVHADGTSEDLLRDPAWNPDEYLNPKLVKWAPAEPYMLRAGDTVHTWCKWHNTDSKALAFPVEMCASVFYFVGNGGKVQPCLDGGWF